MNYELTYKSSVKKELRKINKPDRRIIVEKILQLAVSPLPTGSSKLKASKDLFRIRHGEYRIIYKVEKRVITITIFRVGHRREVYKNL